MPRVLAGHDSFQDLPHGMAPVPTRHPPTCPCFPDALHGSLAFARTHLLAHQVRPPCLQDALPAPPVAYFQRLPCRSTVEVT